MCIKQAISYQYNCLPNIMFIRTHMDNLMSDSFLFVYNIYNKELVFFLAFFFLC